MVNHSWKLHYVLYYDWLIRLVLMSYGLTFLYNKSKVNCINKSKVNLKEKKYKIYKHSPFIFSSFRSIVYIFSHISIFFPLDSSSYNLQILSLLIVYVNCALHKEVTNLFRYIEWKKRSIIFRFWSNILQIGANLI